MNHIVHRTHHLQHLDKHLCFYHSFRQGRAKSTPTILAESVQVGTRGRGPTSSRGGRRRSAGPPTGHTALLRDVCEYSVVDGLARYIVRILSYQRLTPQICTRSRETLCTRPTLAGTPSIFVKGCSSVSLVGAPDRRS